MSPPGGELCIGKLAKTHTSAREFYVIYQETTSKRNLIQKVLWVAYLIVYCFILYYFIFLCSC